MSSSQIGEGKWQGSRGTPCLEVLGGGHVRDSAEQEVGYQGGKGEEGVGFGEVAGSGHRGPRERHACPKEKHVPRPRGGREFNMAGTELQIFKGRE